MKLNFGKRLALFLYWLLSLIGFALAVIWSVWPQLASDMIALVNQVLGAGLAQMAGIAVLAIYVLLTVLSVAIIFSRDKKRGDRGFITVDSSETGRTRIAIGAVEQMIRQAVRCVDGIADLKAGIVNNEDAVTINTSVAIVSGAHVPTVTMNIQRAIRSYIELNCGVAVREVSVSVHSLESAEEGGKQRRRKGAAQAAVSAPSVLQPTEREAPAEEALVEADDEIQLTLDPPAEVLVEDDPVVEEAAADDQQPEAEGEATE